MNTLSITVLHKCNHYGLHSITAANETDAAKSEIELSATFCPSCLEAIVEHNAKPGNTRLETESAVMQSNRKEEKMDTNPQDNPQEKNTFTAPSRYDRSKTQAVGHYRFATLAECKTLTGRVKARDWQGKIAEVKITSMKTWKTRPDVQIGWKFGMYEFGKELITKDSDNRFFVIQLEL